MPSKRLEGSTIHLPVAASVTIATVFNLIQSYSSAMFNWEATSENNWIFALTE